MSGETKIKETQESFEAQQQAQQSWKVGLSTSYGQLVDESMNYGKMASQMFDTTVNGFIGTMQQLAVTGKANFKEMTASILADLAKIAMRMAVMKLINYVGSSIFGVGGTPDASVVAQAKGGVFDRSGRLSAYAAGGVVNSPTYFRHGSGRGLMGESGPEAIVPLSRMPNGDLGVQMMGQGNGGVFAPVNVTVTVNQDGSSESQVNSKGLGQQLGNQIRAVVLDVLIREKMNGGVLYEAH